MHQHDANQEDRDERESSKSHFLSSLLPFLQMELTVFFTETYSPDKYILDGMTCPTGFRMWHLKAYEKEQRELVSIS